MQIAHRKTGGFCLVPDHVAANQKFWDESRKRFMAVPCDCRGIPLPNKRKLAVVLRGDLYGLHTTGTGSMVVSSAQYRKEKA